MLHVDWVKVDALSRSKKGYSETSRYKSTDAFRITIKVAANEFAEQGKRDVFVTLKNPNGIVMNNQGVFLTLTRRILSFQERAFSSIEIAFKK